MDFLKRGEQVVLTSSTDLKNKSGTLYLTNERLQWIEVDSGHEETIYFSEIRSTLDPLGSVFYFTSPNARTELDNFKDTLCKLSKDKSSKGEREGGSGGAPAPAPTLPTHAHIGEDKDSVGSAGPLYPSISDKHGNHPRGLQNPKEDPQLPGAQYTPQQQPTQPPQLSPQSYQQQQQQYQPQQPQQQPQPQSQPYQSPQQPYQPQPTQRPSQSLQYQFDEHDDYPYVSPTTNRKPSVPTSIHIPNTNNTNNTQNNNTGNPNNTKNTNKPRKPKQKEHSDEEDFFSIKEEPEDERRERDDSGGAVSFSIEVRDPQQEVELNGGKYVSYDVVWSRNGQPQKRVRRRYKDFEWLYTHIVGNYQHRTTIPQFPSKSILKSIGSSLPYLTSSDGGAEFTQKRCQKLDKFMKSFVRSPILQQSRSLAVFLSAAPIGHEGQGGVVGFLESHLSGTSLTRKLDDVDIADQNLSDVEMDYKYVRELMMRWDLTPKKLPFEKFLVVVLGTTSAGKSAFVNHFFGLQVKRSAVGQMDTHFTLVETLSRDKFAEYSDKAGLPKPNFSDEDLAKKISGDVYADPRYGYVFLYLDTPKTLSRYEAQFTNYAHYISTYGLVRSIIINEDYLRGTSDKTQLAKRTILLDSPGFDYTKENEHAMEKFLGNLKILQLFYSMSDLSLFMTPATHINMVSNQIATLELSVLYSLHGAEYVDKLLHEILAAPSSSNSGAPTHLIPSIVDIKNYVVQRFVHATSAGDGGKKAEYKGTVVWDKIRFVLTKIDEVFINQPVGNLHEQFFELGRLLGKNLTYLESPTFSQCMAIGLPEHQPHRGATALSPAEEAKTGDLRVLLDLIRSLNSESSYMGRLEASVQMMCLELQSAIKASWSTWISPKQWMSSDTAQLHDIYRRSCLRLKKMSMTHVTHTNHMNHMNQMNHNMMTMMMMTNGAAGGGNGLAHSPSSG